MEKKQKRRKEKGITLVALVVTIIVLLILAGVTIATLFGDNGILIRANEAKEATEQAKQDEEDILSSYEDKINEYAGIDWNTALANAEKHPEQKNSTVVGVGTNGKSVNMDLWEYNFDDVTNGYGLNDTVSLTTTASADASRGYKGTDFNNIIIPQYISIDEGENWIPVTNLDWLFFNCTELEKIDILPFTVKSMRHTFRGCSKLQTVDNFPSQLENMQSTFMDCINVTSVLDIPNTVTNVEGTFSGCSNLQRAPKLPENITNMQLTFANCSSLKVAPEIPLNVTNMQNTFYGCSSLKETPEIPNEVINMQETFYGCLNLRKVTNPIPYKVQNMYATFRECKSLTGTITINANLTGAIVFGEQKDYYSIFYNAVQNDGCKVKLIGDCLILDKIVEHTANPNITL